MKANVNLYHWTAKRRDKDYKPAYLFGVYHDIKNKCAVASDAHIMVVSKSDYNESHAGKIISKAGEKINDVFPDYGKVIPVAGDIIELDRKMIKNKVKQAKTHNKTTLSRTITGIEIYKDICLSVDACIRLLTMPKDMIFSWSGKWPLMGKNANYTAIFMPVSRTAVKKIGCDII